MGAGIDQAGLNLDWSINLFAGLIESGLERLVMSPGSRSTPLVIAADRFPQLEIRVQVDERSAAFFALGQARALDKPVALLCTSGSAPANWLPAVVEASQAGVPLILLTADRPWELQRCDANQTIDQSHLFAGYTRSFFNLSPAEPMATGMQRLRTLGRQAIHESLWPDPGPIHINIPFREPLVPAQISGQIPSLKIVPAQRPELSAGKDQIAELGETLSSAPGIIVCGAGIDDPGFSQAVTTLAAKVGSPILADPLSGLRFGPHDRSLVFSHYDSFLRHAAFIANRQPDWVLRFGSIPVSKALQNYLAGLRTTRHILVENRGRWPDPVNRVTQLFRSDAVPFCQQLVASLQGTSPAEWCDAFRREESSVQAVCEDDRQSLPPEALVIDQLLTVLPEDSLLYSGNSLPIRYLDSYSGKGKKKLRIVANRGVSGIDGNVSTLLGLAAAHQGTGEVVGLLGDLAFFHDMNGLSAARELDATIVLLNNAGGGIFQHLPQSGLESFEAYWRTPLDIDFSHAALMHGLGYQLVKNPENFSGALETALSNRGVDVIEVIIDGKESVDLHQAFIDGTCS